MRATYLLAMVAMTFSCTCSDESRGLDSELRAEVRACLHALESSVRARGVAKVAVLARGCAPACTPLADYGHSARPSAEQVTELFAGCRLFCSSEAKEAWLGAAPAERFSALAEECGPEMYGLTPASAPLLSDSWAVLVRVHEWLEKHRGRMDKELQEGYARAGNRAHFPLPLPAALDDMYTLPAARAAEPSRAAFYVVIEPDERVRAAAVPVARLRPGHLERRPVPGGEFPGQRLESPADDFAEMVALFESAHPPGARIAETPLVLASHNTPVRLLLRVMDELEQSRVALGVAGRTAMAHAIELERITTAGSAAPVLQVTGGGYTLVGGDAEIRVPAGQNARERLVAELDELSVEWAPQAKIELEMPATASVAELAAVLDTIAESNFNVALMRSAG